MVPQLVALLPWGHLRVFLDKLKEREQREWYLRAAVAYGWSRNVLVLQIKSRLREREGKAITNFQRSLPPPDSDLAEQVLKDPYNFTRLPQCRMNFLRSHGANSQAVCQIFCYPPNTLPGRER
jgi:predicted nuclease of restriction endonuclease-like (RecB) superfamily